LGHFLTAVTAVALAAIAFFAARLSWISFRISTESALGPDAAGR
jgi:hypothetical protein